MKSLITGLLFLIAPCVAFAEGINDVPPTPTVGAPPPVKCLATDVQNGRAVCVWIEGQAPQWDKMIDERAWCLNTIYARNAEKDMCFRWYFEPTYQQYLAVKKKCGRKCRKM